MGFLVKTLLLLAIIVFAGYFAINNIPSLRANIIETFNPSIKEGRILGALEENLNQLDTTIAGAANSKNSTDLANKIKQSKDLLTESKKLLNEATIINGNDTGIIKSTIGGIINALTDSTPFPADHLTPPTPTPAPVVCPTK